MKKIKKKDLDELCREEKAYWKDGQGERLGRILELSKRLSKQCGVDWLYISHLAECVYGSLGFAPEKPDEALVAALRVLGVEVV